MIFSQQFRQMVLQAQRAIAVGDVRTGDLLLQRLRIAIKDGGFDPNHPPHQRELMEVMGWIAQTVRKAGGFSSAVPWFEDVTSLASACAPKSEDTAWDYAYLSECQLESGDLFGARRSFREAISVMEFSGSRNQTLRRFLDELEERL